MVYLVLYDELYAPRGCCLCMVARADMESAPTNQKELGKTIRLPGALRTPQIYRGTYIMLQYRKITPADDAGIAKIIRFNLEKFHLDLPGTVYFDPELDHLSGFYNSQPAKRAYFIALGENGQIIGGAGFAEFDGIGNCAELQKLYLNDAAKGKGYGKDLVQLVENAARSAGYKNLYLETHTNLSVALKLYEKMGFQQIEKPHLTQHSTMNRFYLKKL